MFTSVKSGKERASRIEEGKFPARSGYSIFPCSMLGAMSGPIRWVGDVGRS